MGNEIGETVMDLITIAHCHPANHFVFDQAAFDRAQLRSQRRLAVLGAARARLGAQISVIGEYLATRTSLRTSVRP